MKQLTGALFLASLFFLSSGCAHEQALTSAKKDLENQDRVIEDLEARNARLLADVARLTTERDVAVARVRSLSTGREELDQGLDEVGRRLKELEARGLEAGEAGLRFKTHPEGIALELAETVLFDSGRAELTPQGKQLLLQVAAQLRTAAGRIRVEGHTDSAPVVVHAKDYPYGNLQLSGRRALEVAAFLIREGKLSPAKVSFAGFGEHRPALPNSDSSSMARNRRVEIVVVREE